METWNIVGNNFYINYIQENSKYFKKELGKSLTVEKNEDREMREKEFASWYYDKYKCLIFKQGVIGTLHFFIDYRLKENFIGFFRKEDPDVHQYGVEWDIEKGENIDAWLSMKLQDVDNTIAYNKDKESKETTTGDGEKLIQNPGSVSWNDIKDFYQRKKSGKL